MTASPIVTLNVLAVTLLSGALALANQSQVPGLGSQVEARTWDMGPGTWDPICLTVAQATGILALFQFAQSSIATFWQGTNAVAETVGALGGVIGGQSLDIGPSLAGLDFFVLGIAILALLAFECRVRAIGCLIAVVVMLLGHLAYLALLAQSEQILIAANTMRAERLLGHATSVEREQILGAIKFEPQPDTNPIPGLSEQDVAARTAAEKKKFDAELVSLGLERSDLAEISKSLTDDAVFPNWVDAQTRGKLFDKLKAPLDQLEQQRLFGPASRLPYTLDGFLLNVVPWNLPALALLFHTVCVGVILTVAFWRRAPTPADQGTRSSTADSASVGNALRGVPESPNDVATSTRPTERHRGRSLQNPSWHARWLAAIAAVAILLPLATVFSRGFGTYQGKKIVAYEKGFLNWLRPSTATCSTT